MRIGMLAAVVALVASGAALAAPIVVSFDGMTNAQVQAMFPGTGNGPVIAADHGGSVMVFSSGNISNAYRKYSPSGVDFLFDTGTISTDVNVYFDNTGTHGTAAFKGGLLLNAKVPGTEQYFARIVAKPSAGQIVLEVGNLKGTGHSAMGSLVLSSTFAPGAVTGNLGWYNLSAAVSTVNTDQYQVAVTVTDPNSVVTNYTWTDTGTARYTGAYPVGIAGHNQWSTVARYDDFTIVVPEPATLVLVTLGGLFALRRRYA